MRWDSFFGQKETGTERVAMATALSASLFFFCDGRLCNLDGAKFQEHCNSSVF